MDNVRMNTQEMSEKFTVNCWCAPYVVVVRKEDGAKGTLEFTHSPREYFDFREGN